MFPKFILSFISYRQNMSYKKVAQLFTRLVFDITKRKQHVAPSVTKSKIPVPTSGIDQLNWERLYAMSEKFIRLCQEAEIEPQLSFIGGGNMAQALIKGFVKSGLISVDKIGVSDPYPQPLENFKQMNIATSASNLEILNNFGSGLVFLAVKPDTLRNVMEECSGVLSRNVGLIVSILAGTEISTVKKELSMNGQLPLVRVMPNIAAIVGEAASVFARDSNCTDAQANLVHTLMKTVGSCHEVPEYQIDAVTGLSGSGPAYTYTFIDAMSDGGVKMGLPRDLATHLAAQTVLGAAKMILDTQKHPGDLKNMVCSPGGTTIAGVHVLESAGVRGGVISAVEAAVKRANELGAQK